MLINRNMSDLDGKIEIDYKVHNLKVVFHLNLSKILRSLIGLQVELHLNRNLLTSFSSFVVVAVFFTGRKSSAACQRLGLTPPDLRTFVRPDNCQQRYRRHHTLAGGRSRTSPQNTAVGTRVMGVLTPLPLMRVSPDVIQLYPFSLFQIGNNVTRSTPSAPAVRRTNIHSHFTYTQSYRVVACLFP